MKKIFLSAFASTLIASATIAQIPNAGFESWTNMGNYSDPDNWGTLNSSTNLASVYTVTQGTPGNPGSYYIKIVSKTVFSNVVPGIAATGTINPANQTVSGGFAISTRPANLTGKWQYMAMSGTDQGSINVLLTKWNTSTNSRDTISFTQYMLPGMVMSWANFSIPLTYQSAAAPDTGMIVLASSNSTPAANSYLYVDALAFSGITGIAANSFLSGLNMYPNPANDQLTLDLNFNSPQHTVFELVDVTGRKVFSQDAGVLQGETKQTLDLSGVTKGIYLLRIVAESGTETKEIVIE